MNEIKRIQLSLAICDDEPTVVEKLCQLCELILGDQYDLQIDTAFSAKELLEKKGPYQIALLDVQLPEQNGIDLARDLLSREPGCRIIFISGLLNAVSEVYQVPHFCFILKDQLEEQMPRFLRRAAECAAQDAGQTIQIRCGKQVCEIALSDLVFMERRGHITFLTMSDGTVLQSKEKLSDLMGRIGNSNIVRCHISYAVNLAYVAREEESGFSMRQGAWVPISRPNLQSCREALWRYLSEQM